MYIICEINLQETHRSHEGSAFVLCVATLNAVQDNVTYFLVDLIKGINANVYYRNVFAIFLQKIQNRCFPEFYSLYS